MEIRKDSAKIFVISGKARVGKDTSANYMKEYYESLGKKVIILQFSYYIKEYAKVLSGWDGSEEDKPRKLLQELGTDIIRNKIDKDFFTKRTIEDIKVFSYFYDVIIISDARFVSEITMVKDSFLDVISINILRDAINELTLEEKGHITENGLDGYDDYDYVIDNNGSLDDLRNKVIEIVGGLK